MAEKERRYKTLTEILKRPALEKNKKYIGRILEVLVEADQRGYLRGKTRTNKTVRIQIPDTKCQIQTTNVVGRFVKVKTTNVLPWGLKGISA